jgi:hypothetical protein
MEIARFVEAICGKDEFLYLPSAEKVIVPREGTLAIDAMPPQGGLQIKEACRYWILWWREMEMSYRPLSFTVHRGSRYEQSPAHCWSLSSGYNTGPLSSSSAERAYA